MYDDFGTIFADLYSGSSYDWARERAQVKYSYTIELRDKGTRKFLLPPEQIEETGEEVYEAFKVIARQVIYDQKNNRTKIPVPNSSTNRKKVQELINTEEEEYDEDSEEKDKDEEDEVEGVVAML